MTNDGAPQRQTRNRHRSEPPLYDARYEHDACGVGFVADAGGASHSRVLALALGGLGALGHRGAFAADGASSDGAGVLLPLTPSLVRLLDPDGTAGDRPGVLTVFAPARRRADGPGREPALDRRRRARRRRPGRPRLARGARRARCPRPRGRRLPARDPPGAGPAARRRRPTPSSSSRSPAPAAAPTRRHARPASTAFAVVSASSRTRRLQGPRRRRPPRPPVPRPRVAASTSRSPCSTSATRPTRSPCGRSPSRSGTSPTTARSTPSAATARPIRGRRDDAGVPVAPPGRGRPPPRGRSPPLAGRARTRGRSTRRSSCWSRPAGRSRPRCSRWCPRRRACAATPHPAVAAFRRRVAGFVAPWDGPGAFVFSDGRRVGALLDRNGLRPAAWSITADRLVAVASEAGAVPLDPGEIVRTGRLAPGELLLVDPAAGRVLTDADAKSWVLRRLPLHDAPREVFADAEGPTGDPVPGRRPTPRADPAAAPAPEGVAATTPALRYLFGLDAEKLRLDVRTMALDAHEPLWSMGDDTPLAGRGRVTRPASDHLRQAFAQVTNPPIDPERERAVMDLQMELGRRPAFLGGMPAGAETVRVGRPVVVDLDGLLDAVRDRSRAPHRAVRRLDATWPAAARRRRARGRARPARRRRARRRPCGHRGPRPVRRRRLARRPGTTPRPVRPRRGRRAHRARRGRPARPDRHRGRRRGRARRPRARDGRGRRRPGRAPAAAARPRPRAGGLARRGGAVRARRRRATCSPPSTPACARCSPGWASRPSPATSAASCSRPSSWGPPSSPAASPPPPRGPAGSRPPTSPASSCQRLEEARALAAAVRPDRLPDPGFARFRGDGELHLYSPANATRAHDPRRGRRPGDGRRRGPQHLPRRPPARRGARPRRLPRARGPAAPQPCRSTRSRTRARSPAGSSCRR